GTGHEPVADVGRHRRAARRCAAPFGRRPAVNRALARNAVPSEPATVRAEPAASGHSTWPCEAARPLCARSHLPPGERVSYSSPSYCATAASNGSALVSTIPAHGTNGGFGT